MQSSSHFRCKYHPLHNSIGACPVCLTRELLELTLENDEYIGSALQATSSFYKPAPQEELDTPSKGSIIDRENTECNLQEKPNITREESYVKQDAKQPNVIGYGWHPPSPSHTYSRYPQPPSPLHRTGLAFHPPSLLPDEPRSPQKWRQSFSSNGSKPSDYQISYMYKGGSHPSALTSDPAKKSTKISHKPSSYASLWSRITAKKAGHLNSTTGKAKQMHQQGVANLREADEVYHHPKDNVRSSGLHGTNKGSWFPAFLLRKEGKRSSTKKRGGTDCVMWDCDDWMYGRNSDYNNLAHARAAVMPRVSSDVWEAAHASDKGEYITNLSDKKGSRNAKKEIDSHAGGITRKHEDDEVDPWIYGRHSVDQYVASGSPASRPPFSASDGKLVNTNPRKDSLFNMQRQEVIYPLDSTGRLGASSPYHCTPPQSPPRLSLDGAPTRFFKNNPITSIWRKKPKGGIVNPLFVPDVHGQESARNSVDSAAARFGHATHRLAATFAKDRRGVMESSADISAGADTIALNRPNTAAWPRFSPGLNTGSKDNLLDVVGLSIPPEQSANAMRSQTFLDNFAAANSSGERRSTASMLPKQQMVVQPLDVPAERIHPDSNESIASRQLENRSSEFFIAADYLHSFPSGTALPSTKQETIDAANSSSNQFCKGGEQSTPKHHAMRVSPCIISCRCAEPAASLDAASVRLMQRPTVMSCSEIMIIPNSCCHLVSTGRPSTVHIHRGGKPWPDPAHFRTIIAASRHSVDGSSSTSLLSRS